MDLEFMAMEFYRLDVDVFHFPSVHYKEKAYS
jgi:hypothetical protein